MTGRIGVLAPDDLEWVRAAAGSLALAEDIHTASVVVTTPNRVSEVLERVPGTPVVMIGDASELVGRSQNDPRIAHVIRRSLSVEHVSVLLGSFAGRRRCPQPLGGMAGGREAQRAFLASRSLAASSDLAEAESAAIAAVLELIAADRAHCLFHDPADGSLWSETRMRDSGDERRAVAGLAGFAARTGIMAAAERVGEDPRWLAAIDDPTGRDDDRLLAQPIASPTGAVQAVLVAVRAGRQPAFSSADADLLARYAELAAPFMDQLASHHQLHGAADDAALDDALFRTEAIEAQREARSGDVIRVTPPWMGRAYWALVALVLGAAAYATVGTVATYSAGPAVIRATARVEVVARTQGNVTTVEVMPGRKVAPGTVVARLDDEIQRAALDRAQEEFDSQLRTHLLDPSDSVADTALRQLRQSRDAARAALEERVVRAASSGEVADVRVHPGQHLNPGDIVASLLEGSSGLEIIALLPGEDRPQLASGMAIRLELHGYQYAYQSLVIDSVSPDVIGPTEARRVLGPGVADSMQLGGPVALVRGRLGQDVFEADGRTFGYHDGMLGVVDVRVREERILFTLLPWLKRL
jgi:membrane fusion protein (multidrug efflux system)